MSLILREPLLLPAAALAAGIVLSRLVSFGLPELLAHGGALLLVAVAAWRLGARRAAYASVLLGVLFAGIFIEVIQRPGAPPVLDAHPREVVILEGCVVEPSVFSEDRQRFTLELAPRARVLVSVYPRNGERPPDLRYGQRVELEARVRRPRNFGNPGSFDYEGYLARRDIYWTASAPAGSPIRVLNGECGNRLRRGLYVLRSAALARLERLYQGKPYEIAMMQAVLIGEKSRVERVWTDHFRYTGTYHALVISGLHLTVLAGVILFLLRLCPIGPEAALLIATVFGWLYALVTGWQTPVVRAAGGLTVYLAARYFYRRPRLLNLLAAVAIGFLISDPHQLFEASFQLSFLAVAAIAVLAVPLLEKTSAPYGFGLRSPGDRDRDLDLEPKVAQARVELRLVAETIALWTRFPERWALASIAGVLRLGLFVYELAAVSMAVQLGLVLPMAIYFHRVSLSGLTANLAVVPLTSLLVPVGFLAVVTGWSPPAAVAGWLLGLTRQVVGWHAGWEPWWRIPDPPLWLTAAFSASLVLVGVTVRCAPRLRWGSLAVISVLLAILLWHPFPPKVERGELEFTAIDVGQGDSFFVAFPDGRLVLVDGGGIPGQAGGGSARLDIGEDVISPYLWSRSIRRLDAVISSHAHEDHAGGLPALIQNFRPKELWTGPQAETEAWKRLKQAARRSGASLRILRGGQRFNWGGVWIEVLSPLEDPPPNGQVRDDDSVVLRLSYARRSILLTGDATRKVEDALAERGLLARTDILKVAHHGSRTSTTVGFLATVQPVFGVISAGFENRHGHPHPSVIERLRAIRCTPARTDQLGTITIHLDGGRRIRLDTNRWTEKRRGLLRAF